MGTWNQRRSVEFDMAPAVLFFLFIICWLISGLDRKELSEWRESKRESRICIIVDVGVGAAINPVI